MTTQETKDTNLDEAILFEDTWKIPYRYSASPVTVRFFQALRDRKILASPCPDCGAVYLPPRSYCERCFVEIADLTEVGQHGTVTAFTTVHAQFEGMPEPPYTVAYVMLDGASTSVVNYMQGLNYDGMSLVDDVHIGTKVSLVFSDEPAGRMTDFHFELDASDQ